MATACRPDSIRSSRRRCRLDLIRLLFRLRLRYIRQAGPSILARAREEGWDYVELLKVLLAEEAAGRDRATREVHRKAARLPSGKTFDAWDPKASAIPGDAQWALRTLDWIGRAENLVLVGPSGTGKSHFAEAIAHAAIDRDLRVSWFTLEALTATIARSRIDASTGKVVERIIRSELVVVDDIGLLPAGADEAEALYRLVDAAYERRSLILTSNLHPARFDSIFPKGLATAAVDQPAGRARASLRLAAHLALGKRGLRELADVTDPRAASERGRGHCHERRERPTSDRTPRLVRQDRG